MKKPSSILFIFILTLLCLSMSGCEKFIYSIEASNKSNYGVLILQIGDRHATGLHNYYSKVGVGLPIIAGLHPGIGGGAAVNLSRFQGYNRSLPDQVEIVWKLAELRDCHETEWSRGELDVYTCRTWTPLPDKIYRKTLDMATIRESEAYKKTGKRNPNVGGSRYTLRLNLIFNEDQLTVEADNGSTNPWR